MTDDFPHTLTPLQEYILYKVLIFMNDVLDSDDQSDIFSTQIKAHYEKYRETSDASKEMLNSKKNINDLIGLIFEDVDFLDVSILYQMYLTNPGNFEKKFNVDLDDYIDLMPADIQENYKKIRNTDLSIYSSDSSLVRIQTKEEFIGIIRGVMERFNHYVIQRKLYKLINNKKRTFSEDEVQILFDFFIDLYLEKYDLDISREPNTGRGCVDFKISCGKQFRALIEFKVDSHTSLEKGLMYQLPLYQHASEIDYGIFSIIYCNENLYEQRNIFKEDAKKIADEYNTTIEFFPIDARDNKKSAANVKSKKDMLIEERMNIR
ncbi:hypothetical protein [Paenibacillus xylanexedens]|uniref:hypothetical protein n=1 Tax=Paenibacillus xylanexedens TaxID=528191 RepID=UPI00119E28D4|nr:hypothetical protein [Paenibacillus xylanexedens]